MYVSTRVFVLSKKLLTFNEFSSAIVQLHKLKYVIAVTFRKL